MSPRFKADLIDFVSKGALIKMLKVIGKDGRIALLRTGGAVTNMLKLARMDKVFHMYQNADEAAAALSFRWKAST